MVQREEMTVTEVYVSSNVHYLQQTFLFAQMLVYFLVQVVQALLHFFTGIFFNNFAQLLLVEGQVVAHLLLADALGHTGLNALEEMLRSGHNSTERPEHKPELGKPFPTYVELFQRLAQRIDDVGL